VWRGKMLYVPGVDGSVHKLDWRTGRELNGAGFPARIAMSPGTGKIASAAQRRQRSYAVTSGYLGDPTPYVGHVVASRLRDGSKHVFVTNADDAPVDAMGGRAAAEVDALPRT
jgi:hypothetical protein